MAAVKQALVIWICGLEECFSFHDTRAPFSVILAAQPEFSGEQLCLITRPRRALSRSV
jgi:hypothetical protein